jgi:hypothetical protein
VLAPSAGPSLRGIGAAVVGVVSYRIITVLLEMMLVGSNSETPPQDYAAHYAVLSRPGVAAAKLVIDSLVAVWAGYMAAKVAGERELTYGLLAAILVTVQLAWQHLASDFAGATPWWMRAGLLLVTPPAMLAGAWVRGRARVAAAGTAGPGQPQERS